MYKKKIREEAKANKVMLWEVAEQLEITDGTLSRKLRRELPEDEQQRIIEIIHAIAEGRC